MEEFLLYIGKVNLLAAAVILLTAAVSGNVDQNYSVRWKYRIWIILAILMLIPIRVPESWNLVQIEVPVTFSDSGNQPQGTDTGQEAVTEIQRETGKIIQTDATFSYKQEGSGPEKSGYRRLTPEFAAKAAAAVWSVGILVLGIRKALEIYLAEKKLRRWNVPNWNRQLEYRYRKLCREEKLKRAPRLMLNSMLTTPLLSGVHDPCICLPLSGYTAEEQELILCHELCHYRRRDLWYKFFLEILCIVYWFNPALRWMKKEAGRNIEFLCDETVMRNRTVSEKMTYSRLLAKTASGKKYEKGVSTSLNDSLAALKKRMVNIMRAGRLKKGTALTACFLAVFLLGNVITGCSFREDSEMTDSMNSREIPDADPEQEQNISDDQDMPDSDKKVRQENDSQPLSTVPLENGENDNLEKTERDSSDSWKKEETLNSQDGSASGRPAEVEQEDSGDEISAPDTVRETLNSEQPSAVTQTDPVPTPTPQETQLSSPSIELLDYMNSNQVQEFADDLRLEKKEGKMFGESGIRYQNATIEIEWEYKTEDFYDWGIEESMYDFIGTVQCEGNPDLGVYGVTCGMNMDEVRSAMISDGWRPIGIYQQAFLREDATGYNREYIQFETDGTEIVQWSWCNWPEGDI